MGILSGWPILGIVTIDPLGDLIYAMRLGDCLVLPLVSLLLKLNVYPVCEAPGMKLVLFLKELLV